jgi:succinyl-diaminopimelate desuccinylase
MAEPKVDAIAEPVDDEILELAKKLIRIPSQAGIDTPDAVLAEIGRWFREQGLPGELLYDASGHPCAFYAESCSAGSTGSDNEPEAFADESAADTSPLYILDACIDTASIGDPKSWSFPPFGAEVHDSWLYGRGAGDSKIAVSIFSHVFRFFHRHGGPVSGRLGVLFDADEHTGRFGGVRELISRRSAVSGVCIGYPGFDELVIGARGFYRFRITVPGTGAHTGMPHRSVDNAARTGAELITRLYGDWEQFAALVDFDENFPFGPSLTVTEVRSGTAFSVVPDSCSIAVDTRLTGTCSAAGVRDFLNQFLQQYPGAVNEEVDSWPAYTLAKDHVLVQALGSAAEKVTGEALPLIYCGPSNIGNYLASLGVPATCGFGVVCENFHAADERIRIDTIQPVYQAYKNMVSKIVG